MAQAYISPARYTLLKCTDSQIRALVISIAIKSWFSLNAFFFLLFVFYVPKISSRTIKAIQVSYAAVFGYDTKDICEAIAVWVKILAFRSENIKCSDTQKSAFLNHVS